MQKIVLEELINIILDEIKGNASELNEVLTQMGVTDPSIKTLFIKKMLKEEVSIIASKIISEADDITDRALQKMPSSERFKLGKQIVANPALRKKVVAALKAIAKRDGNTEALRVAKGFGDKVRPDDKEFFVSADLPVSNEPEEPKSKPAGTKPAAAPKAAPAAAPKAEPKSTKATEPAAPKKAEPKPAPAKKGKTEKQPATPAKKEPHRGSSKKAKEREREAGQGKGKSDKGPTVPYIHGRKMSPRAKAERERIGKEMLGGGKDNDGNPLPLAGRSSVMRNWSAKRRKAANNRMNRVKEKFKRRAVKFGWPESAWKSFLWATASDIAIKKYGGTATRTANPISARPKKPKQ